MALLKSVACRPPGILLVLLLLVVIAPLQVYGSTVIVPIELDYPLLRQLLIKQLFNTAKQRREMLNDPSGCSQIILSNPQLSGRRPDLEIATEVTARLGVGILGSCTNLLQWRGSAVFVGRPVIQPGATALRIEPVDSWLTDADGARITSGEVWELVKVGFQPLFGGFAFDLKPPIDNLGMILPEVLPGRSTQQLQAIVGSLRLSNIQVSPTSLDVSLSLQVEGLAAQPRPEAALSSQELQQWEARWQMMDALFTFAVKHYASATSLRELRSALLDILLDSRYRLRDALTAPISHSEDPVRHWFLDSWQRLGPVIRRVGLEQSGQEPLLWISLVTATDALYALDQLGPAIGLDISADGLRRLARLLSGKAGVDPLRYDQAMDPELLQLFQLPPVVEPAQPLGGRLQSWPIPTARAATATDRLNRWVPDKDQLKTYLPLVAGLLKTTAGTAKKQHKLTPATAKLFEKLVPATAWQESCWRQYVVSKKKIEPLRSSTGDVGIMQLNEKIWRGFYDIQRLRWDIAYNSKAGAEVLLNYLTKYILPQGEHKRSGGIDNLARASYSAYNGGPSQVARYRNPKASPDDKKIDASFWKKYQQVAAGNQMNVAQCLGGDTAKKGEAQSATKKAGKNASGRKTK